MIDQNFVLPTWWAVTAGVLTAIGGAGGVVALIKSGADRRKIIAEASKTDVEKVALLSTVAMELVESMRTQITDLKTDLKEAKTRAAEAETRLRQSGEVADLTVDSPTAAMTRRRRDISSAPAGPDGG